MNVMVKVDFLLLRQILSYLSNTTAPPPSPPRPALPPRPTGLAFGPRGDPDPTSARVVEPAQVIGVAALPS